MIEVRCFIEPLERLTCSKTLSEDLQTELSYRACVVGLLLTDSLQGIFALKVPVVCLIFFGRLYWLEWRFIIPREVRFVILLISSKLDCTCLDTITVEVIEGLPRLKLELGFL